jgi:hypothetical protein
LLFSWREKENIMAYKINGSDVEVGSDPRLKDGTLWVPLRSVAQSLGASVDYEPSNGVAIVYQGENVITVQIDDTNVDVNGTSHTLQAAPYVEDGEAWVPVRFFNAAMGIGVNVDLQNNSVDLSTPDVV